MRKKRLAAAMGRGGSSGLPQPDFDLPLDNSLIPRRGGSTTATYTRADASDGLAQVTDHESKTAQVLSGESRFMGSRRVRNLITASEDMTNGAYTFGTASAISATQVTYTGTASEYVQQSRTITDDGSGKD